MDSSTDNKINVLLNALPEEDAPKVIAQALCFQADALTREQNAKASFDAVTEMDVSEKHLRQAVEAYQKQKQGSHRRSIRGALTVAALVSVVGALTYSAKRPIPPVHFSEDFNTAPEIRWRGRTNPESLGDASFAAQADGHRLVAFFYMQEARRDGQGHWHGRLESRVRPPRLAGDRLARFSVSGSTVKVRMVFENDTDRWVSPAIPTAPALPFDTVTLRISDFSHQARTPSGGWHPARAAPLYDVDRIAFEADDQDNPLVTAGGFAVDDLDIR